MPRSKIPGPMYLYPTPDEEGISKTKTFYKEKHNREITDDQAADILSRVMRYIYLTQSDLPDEKSD